MLRRILPVVLTIVYPFVVLVGLKYWGLTVPVIAVVCLAAVNLLTNPRPLPLFLFIISLLLAAVSCYNQAFLPLKLYPVAVNIVLLGLFFASLFSKQSAIERLARIKEPELSPKGVLYTRKLTFVWCVFFFINGSIALWSALFASNEIWALYNGFLAYILIGIFFITEWLFRRYFLSR